MKLNLFVLLTTTPAVVQATYSIAATEQSNQLIGGAGASCVQDSDIGAILYHGVPGHGVLHTQAVALDADSEPVNTGLELIKQDMDPATILLNMNGLDTGTSYSDGYQIGNGVPDSEFRQNAIVNLQGQHAAWTGTYIDNLYVEGAEIMGTNQSDDGASMGDYTFSAQGNVVSNETVGFLVTGFSGEGCDLADKLMNAIEAVSKNGAGDERCLQAKYDPKEISGTPSAGGFVKVQAPNGDYVIDINVLGNGTVDPTIELREKFDAWRADNPCGESTEGGATKAPAAGGESTTTPAATMVPGTSGASSRSVYLALTSASSLMALLVLLA